MPAQYFVEVASFLDFARYVCAFREYPLRVYSFEYRGKNIFSSRTVLSESIIHFYTDATKEGGYISYDPLGGKEKANVVNATKTVSNYAPIIHIKTLPFSLSPPKKLKDKFKTIKVQDLGNLARLTYNPELPEELELTLFSFPLRKNWVVGYITKIDLEDIVFCFNYVELNEEPKSPFLKYSGHEGGSAEFSNKFQHGFPYLPVVKLKQTHPIFGLQ